MTATTGDLWSWKRSTSYLIPTGTRRRRCMIFEKNPHWNGVLRNGASARNSDPSESHDAAALVKARDIHEAREHVDILLAKGQGIISTELREHMLRGIANGTIESHGLAANVRAESMRRRFSDLCR
jgi:hypothetical protein